MGQVWDNFSLKQENMKKKKPVDVVGTKGVSIYQEAVESKGKKYISFRVIYYKGGKRCRERAATLEEAKERAKEIAEELSGSLPEDRSPFTRREREVVEAAIDTLAPLNMRISDAARTMAEVKEILGEKCTPQEAARAFVKQSERGEIKEKTLGDVYEEFMATLASEGGATVREYKRSFRYWQDCCQRLGALAEHFKDTLISDIKARELDAFLDKMPVRHVTATGVRYTGEFTSPQGRTRNNYRGAFCTLFSFARKKEYLPRDIKTEAQYMQVAGETKTKKELSVGLRKKIYTPSDMQEILDGLPDRWIPFAALGAFAGIRTAELHRLQWEDINFGRKFIEVEKDQAKMGSRRVISMSDQLIAWLKPLAQKAGWVVPHYAHDSTLNIEFKKARKLIPVPMIMNGHRHSYATYRIWEVGDESKVAWEMNTSVRKLHSNYFSPADELALKEWKKVLPKKTRWKGKKV